MSQGIDNQKQQDSQALLEIQVCQGVCIMFWCRIILIVRIDTIIASYLSIKHEYITLTIDVHSFLIFDAALQNLDLTL